MANLANPAGGLAGTSPIGSISAINPNLKYTTTYQYSLGLQQQLRRGTFLEVSSTNAFVPYLGYSTIQQYLNDSTIQLQCLAGLRFQARRRNCLYGGLYLVEGPRRFQRRGQQPGGLPESALQLWSSFVRPRAHVYGTFVWQLATLARQNAIVRSVAGGWQLSGVIRLQTGDPYTVTASTSTSTRRADYLGGSLNVANPSSALWFNTVAFAQAGIGSYGNSGAGIIRGPGLQSYDLSQPSVSQSESGSTSSFKVTFSTLSVS
jgi:hypothetical protein